MKKILNRIFTNWETAFLGLLKSLNLAGLLAGVPPTAAIIIHMALEIIQGALQKDADTTGNGASATKTGS